MKLSKRTLLRTAALSLALAAPAQAMDDDIATECGTCQFPTSVTIGLCSGVYMGQGLVLTAAHCDDDINEGTSRAYFGENDDEVASAVVDHCVRHPDGEFDTGVFGDQSYNSVDLAYCILDDAESIPDLPIVPPMIPTGCERDWLAHQVYESGSSPIVTAVGSGCADGYNGGTYCAGGVKRYVALQLTGQVPHAGSNTMLAVERWGEISTGIMHGDSGGPLFDVMPDGTWRLLGVHSSTSASADYSQAVPPYLHWIEAESGIDITPCHSFANGQWSVNDACEGELPLDTNVAGESWANACPSALGGGIVGLNGICSGWPTNPDEWAVAPSASPLLPSNVFTLAASLVVSKPPARRSSATNKIIAKFEPLAVFPFLANELPGMVSMSLLKDKPTLKRVERMMRSKR